MASVLTSILPTTELEAVNLMLSVIGESPLPVGTDLATVTQSDVVMAIQLLREAALNVQAEGWKFNREYGYQLAPTGTSPFSWVDTAGVTTSLNIFKLPAGVISFEITQSSNQIGWKQVDATLRPSRKYVESTKPVLVLYDRKHNRDGFAVADYPYLYINPVWAFDFELLPTQARTYIAIVAARRLAARAVGSQSLVQFSQMDELAALRQLKREYGSEDTFNIFQNAGSYNFLGGRRPGVTGRIDTRGTAGPT